MKPVRVHLLFMGSEDADQTLMEMLDFQNVNVKVTRFGGNSPHGGPNEGRELARQNGALVLFGGCFPKTEDAVAASVRFGVKPDWYRDRRAASAMRREWDIIWPEHGKPEYCSNLLGAINTARARIAEWNASPTAFPTPLWRQGIGSDWQDCAPIPKRICMAWLGKRPLSDLGKRCVESWISLHPDWEIKLWCDEDSRPGLPAEWTPLLAPVEEILRPVRAIYDAASNYGEKADILRLLLQEEGCVWTDCDVECLRPIDDLIRGVSAFVAAGDQPGVLQIENAVMAAAPGHPLIRHMLYTLPWWISLRPTIDTIYKTGPCYIDGWVRLWCGNAFSLARDGDPRVVNGLAIHPRSYWYQSEGVEIARKNGAYGYHHWEGAWYR